jgi:hypothetical protein
MVILNFILQVLFALLLLWGSINLVFNERAVEAFAETGHKDWIRLLLGWSEIVACILFIIPRTFFVGGIGLLIILVWAAYLHISAGQPVGLLPFYLLVLLGFFAYRMYLLRKKRVDSE